ncbi:MAG: carbonic anhydrase [Actinobacteria bacterium]|nr:carbonic anhydrase [Actinomycetota bacterium]
MGLDRTSFLVATGGAAVGLTVTGAAAAPESRPRTPKQALDRLMAGNGRFVRGKLTSVKAIVERRRDVAGGQKPYAILLTCADSRVPPEHVFDKGLGEIFVCRVAGNILEAQIIGSIEYSVTHFDSLLVMVLGHQRCGAVNDTIKLVEADKKAPGHIQSIVDAIAPVVRANPRNGLPDAAYVDKIVKANARAVTKSLLQRSAILRSAVSAKKLNVVAAEYSLDSGKVQLLH